VNMTEVQTQGNVGSAAGNTVSLHSKVWYLSYQCEALDDEACILAYLIIMLQHFQHMLHQLKYRCWVTNLYSMAA
jgi:hypothetical protein